MPVSDPIADMLTRLRNANNAGHEEVLVPSSRVNLGIAKILREEGFIKHYKVSRVRAEKGRRRGGVQVRERERAKPSDKRSEIRVFLKYGPSEEKVLHGLERLSRPSLRRYAGATEVPLVEGGLGIAIVSTSRGLLTGEQCRKRNIGGELLCRVW